MSFWLGAFTALAVMTAVDIILALFYYGDSIDVDSAYIGAAIFLLVVHFTLANLIHLGVIP